MGHAIRFEFSKYTSLIKIRNYPTSTNAADVSFSDTDLWTPSRSGVVLYVEKSRLTTLLTLFI